MVPGSGLVSGEQRFEVLVAGLLAAVLLGGAAFAGSIVVTAMTATGVLGTGASLWLLLALLLMVLLTGVVAAGASAWLAWLALGQLRTATVSGWRRLLWTGYQRARAFEEGSLLGRTLRPTRLFEARGDREGHLVEELKTRYVAGEVDEVDFERELGRLLGGGADVGRQVREEIEVTAADGGDGRQDSPASGRPTNAGDRAVGASDPEVVDREPERERGTE